MDRNGRDDLVLGSGTAGDVIMSVVNPAYLMDFEEGCHTSASPLAIGDLDADGVDDLLVVSGDQVGWVSDPSTTCSTPRYLYSVPSGDPPPFFGAIVDLDDDGRPDIVTVGASVMRAMQVEAAPGAFQAVETFEIQNQWNRNRLLDAAVADLTRDGLPDLLVAMPDGEVVLLETLPSGDARLFWITESSIRTHHLALGDVDNNGWIDLVADGSVYLRKGPWPGEFDFAYATLANGLVYPNGAAVEGTGMLVDLDEDGNLDYIVADPRRGVIEARGE